MEAELAKAPEDVQYYARLALALGIGFIVGVERGWKLRNVEDGARVAGLRTFTLLGLLGGLVGLSGTHMGDALVVGVFASLVAFLAVTYVIAFQRTKVLGITTEVAALITFILGVMAVRGDMTAAASAAVVLVTVLNLREPAHRWIKQVEKAEISAAIMLLVISVVALPVLPDRGFGPGEVLNPYELWWMVVLISGMSFAGYAAIKLAGPGAGILLTGVMGGLASSTAVTISCARMAKSSPTLAPALAGGIAAAGAVMFLRALGITAVLFPPAALVLAPALGLASLTALGLALLWALGKSAGRAKAGLDLGSPADLGMAIKFAVMLAAVSLAVYYAEEWFGTQGILATAAISGLVDVDAITLSVSRMGEGLTPRIAAGAVLIAVAVNTVAKTVYAIVIGGKALTRPTLILLGACAAAGALGYGAGAVLTPS